MIIVDGERIWVPDDRIDLEAGLRRMGIIKVSGIPLRRVGKEALVKEYCRRRAAIVKRNHATTQYDESQDTTTRNDDAMQPRLLE